MKLSDQSIKVEPIWIRLYLDDVDDDEEWIELPICHIRSYKFLLLPLFVVFRFSVSFALTFIYFTLYSFYWHFGICINVFCWYWSSFIQTTKLSCSIQFQLICWTIISHSTGDASVDKWRWMRMKYKKMKKKKFERLIHSSYSHSRSHLTFVAFLKYRITRNSWNHLSVFIILSIVMKSNWTSFNGIYIP